MLYKNGEIYDLVYGGYAEDIPFYLDHARRARKGAVLELFCGTGRLTLPIAQEGIEVVGLDLSEQLLRHAEIKAKAQGLDVQWSCQDATRFELGRRFDLIIAPFNSTQHIVDTASFVGMLKRAHQHLADDGRFVFDMIDLAAFIPERHGLARGKIQEYVDPSTGELVLGDAR